MIQNVPCPGVDGPSLIIRKVISPPTWGVDAKFKSLIIRNTCGIIHKRRSFTRRQVERGSLMSLEVNPLRYGILADDDIKNLVREAAYVAGLSNTMTKQLMAALNLSLAEHRRLEQYGSLDEYDDTS
jgi:hypothetical protein